MPANPGQRTSLTLGAAQPGDDRAAFSACARHPQVQRAQPAVDEEAVERPGHGADGVLHEPHALVGPRSR